MQQSSDPEIGIEKHFNQTTHVLCGEAQQFLLDAGRLRWIGR
jgi:hypothetical protein